MVRMIRPEASLPRRTKQGQQQPEQQAEVRARAQVRELELEPEVEAPVYEGWDPPSCSGR